MRKLSQLWRALEDIPGLITTSAYWKRHCGLDYAFLRPFLHATELTGGNYPCDKPEPEGCARQIVILDSSEVSAICRQEWARCPDVTLTLDDTLLYEIDLQSFIDTLAATLGVASANSAYAPHGPWTLGLAPEELGGQRAAMMIIEASPADFRAAVFALVAGSDSRKVILSPSGRFMDVEIQDLLDRHGVLFYSLEELVLGLEDQTFVSSRLLPNLGRDRRETKARVISGVGPASRRRGRGFRANASDHMKVVAAVASFGENWMDQLSQVCQELHRLGADLPEYWRNEFMESWEEIADAIIGPGKSAGRERVAKYIKYRINWLRQFPPKST